MTNLRTICQGFFEPTYEIFHTLTTNTAYSQVEQLIQVITDNPMSQHTSLRPRHSGTVPCENANVQAVIRMW